MNRKQMIQEKRDALKQIPKRELIDRICNYPDQQSLNRDADGNWRDHPVGQMAHQIRDKQNYQMSEKQYYSLIHHYAALTIPELRVVGVTHRENDSFEFERTVAGHDKNTTTYDMQYHLKPEPENPYDKNAVAVYVEKRDGSEHQIGYVGRKFLEVHPITEEQTVDGTMIDFSNGHLNNVSYRFPIDTEVLEARRQVVQQELPVDVQYGDKYVYERRFALSPQSRVTDREQLQTWWKQQDTQSNGSSYLTKAVNDELSFYKTAGAEQVDSAEFVFTNGREGVIRLTSEQELSHPSLLVANSYLNYLQEGPVGAEMKECPYVQIPLTADSFVNIHENSFEQVATPAAEKTAEINSVQTETSIPNIDSYEQMTLDDYLSKQQESKQMQYRTNFELEHAVLDEEAANAYLQREDMTEILLERHPELDGVVSNITWMLDDDVNGHIDLITTRPLTDTESTLISNWVSGQNSDGLGEGFEQQSWANYEVEEDLYGQEDGDWVMASFDWETNFYKFHPVSMDLALTDADLQFDTDTKDVSLEIDAEEEKTAGKKYQISFFMNDQLEGYEDDDLDGEMTVGLQDQLMVSGLDDVVYSAWKFTSGDEGFVTLVTREPLFEDDLDSISEWIRLQEMEDVTNIDVGMWEETNLSEKELQRYESMDENDLAFTEEDLENLSDGTTHTEHSESGGKLYHASFYMYDPLAEEDRVYSDAEMTEKLHEQIRTSGLSQDVVAGTWMFLDEKEGFINLISSRTLQAAELNQISDWAFRQDVGMSLDIGRWSEHDLSEKAFQMHASTNQTNPNQPSSALTEADLQGLADEDYLFQ